MDPVNDCGGSARNAALCSIIHESRADPKSGRPAYLGVLDAYLPLAVRGSTASLWHQKDAFDVISSGEAS
ncbi:MAG: hypothetical protein MPJ06_03990 [Nitrosopumilus sp.]|nr:hypothetical protein [Nitrosopumilus sp.]